MGKSTEVETTTGEVITGEVVGYADDFEYETVHTEAADLIQFEAPGDKYIGKWVGWSVIDNPDRTRENKWFIQLHFTDPQGARNINPGYDLRRAFLDVRMDDNGGYLDAKEVVPLQEIYRILYVKDVDVDQNDMMRSFRVDQAKSRVSAGNSAA
jgi:hypothetical protein